MDLVMEDELILYLNKIEKYTITDLAKIWEVKYGSFIRKCKYKYKIKLSNWKSEPKIKIEPELLYSLYWGNQFSQREIANMFKCGRKTITKLMRRFNISIRNPSEYLKLIDCKTRFKKGIRNNEKGEFKKGLIPWNKNSNKNLLFTKKMRNYIDKDYKWHNKIFERDNYTCQICGKKNCELNAHHIYSISSTIKDFVKIYGEDFEKAKIDENILSLENGITLCKNCHRDIHKIRR